MPKLKKSIQTENLAQYRVWVTDTDPNSRYFRLTQVPEILTGGKNAFLINGSPELVSTTEVKIEIVDSNGNAVFLQPIRNYVEGLARVVSIEIYEDIPAGPATITILGHLKEDADGNVPPDEWKSVYNVKWQKQVLIAPSLKNTTKIRLYQFPEIEVREILASYKKSSPGSTVTRINTGSITVRTNRNDAAPIQGLPAFSTTLTSDTLTLDRRFANNGFLFATLTSQDGTVSPYTASIARVINNKTAQLSFIDGVPADVAPRQTNSYKITFVDDTSFSDTALSRSFVDVKLSKLTTFSGDIARAKLYVKSIDQPGDYQPLTDIQLEATELTATSSVDANQQITRIGYFSDQTVVEKYWTQGVISSSRYIQSTAVTASYNNAELLDAAYISNPLTPFNTPSSVPQYFFGLRDELTFTEGMEYTLKADIACVKTNPLMNARMDVYLMGAAFPSSSDSPLGYQLATFEVENGETRRRFTDFSKNFTSLNAGTARLRFVVYSGGWYWSNIGIFSARETGFNPDEVQIVTPITGRRFERLQFKAELYDNDSNYVPVVIESAPVLFDGGNLVFRGDDTRIDGTLIISPSGSGPILTSKGFLNTSSIFTPGQAIGIGPVIPQVKNANTAFFAGTSSNGPEVSIGDKLYGYREGGTGQFILEIDGTLVITTGSNKFDIRNLFPQIVTSARVTGQDISFVYVSASAHDPLNLVSASVSVQVQPVGSTTATFGGSTWAIARPSGSVVSKINFIGSAPNRREGNDFIMVQPIGSFSGSATINSFLKLVMVNVSETTGSLIVSTSINSASGSLATPTISIFNQNNIRFVTSLGAGRYEIGKPLSGSGQVTFRSLLPNFIDDYDNVIVNNQSSANQAALNIQATVTSETPTQLVVSCSVVDSLNQPNFSIVATKEPSTSNITISGTNPFTVTKQIGSGSARVKFVATQAGRTPDSDIVVIPSVPSFLNLVMSVVGETTGALFVSAALNEAVGALVTPIVSVVASSNVRYVNLSSGVYEIGKPISGSGEVTFKNSLPGYNDDFDKVTINNQNSVGLPRLTTIATVTSETSTQIIVSCSVVDALNGPPSFVLSTSREPANAAITITGTNPFTISKPIGSGSAKVNFIATQANRVGDVDVVFVPNINQPSLTIRSELQGIVSGTYVYRVVAIDPIPENTISFQMQGVNASPIPLTQVTASGAPFTLNIIPASNGTNGRVSIVATSPRRVSGSDAIDVTGTSDNGLATVGFVSSSATSFGIPTLIFSASATSTVRDVEVWVTELLSGTSQSLDYALFSRTGYQNPDSPFTRNTNGVSEIFNTAIESSRPGTWLSITLCPFDMSGRLGVPVNRLIEIPTAVTVLPNNFTARANVSVTSDSITNTVTMPATNLPTHIRVYRNSSNIGDILRTALPNATQTITHTGLLPNTSYTWEYSAVSASAETAKISPLVVSTTGATLLAPSASYAGTVNNKLTFTITNAGSYPVGTTFAGDYNVGGGNISLNVVSTTNLHSVEEYFATVNGTARFIALNNSYTTSNFSSPISFIGGGNLI